MKKFSTITSGLLVLALAVLVGLPQANAFADEQQLPYKAGGPEYVLQEAPHPDCGPGKLKVEVEGSGQ